MRIITDKEISETTAKVYITWFNISDKLSIIDILILNKMGNYYTNGEPCGLKELEAELDIIKSRISKSISRWVDLGYLTEVASKTDRRRSFYIPTELMMEARSGAFKDIRKMHDALRSDV